MTATQLPLALAERHRNQQLFSDYYLNAILPARPEWRLLAADARPALAEITTIFAAYTPTGSEAQLEDDLVKPVLRALGHTFEVQAALKTADGVKKPDYIFYRDAAALQANKGVTPLSEELLAPGMIAVGDAKRWERNLDMAVKEGADALSNKNPAYQIAFYMQQSGATWGILTNGRLWRLYHTDSAHKLDRYYEVDLTALVEAGDAEAFLYFFGFFGRAAFDDGPLGLAAVLRASTDYARAIGDSLKAQVYDALLHLAQGFLDAPGNRLQTDPATLKQIFDHSLIVLYRLLFILYAEARELLPLRESSDYRAEYSLYAITREIARRSAGGTRLLPTTARLWQRLRDLFGIIHAGSPPLKVATFNGGLFDPARYPFLEQYTVGDVHLQQALDGLARVDGQFIDYRDLAERHLGTIYEGLLEYHLQPIAPEGGWTVAIINDTGERHRTGSYYTPDFVVQYIVDQTLGPVLRRAVDGKQSDAEQIAAVLAVNVCDPAMGSGHFPVAATEYIARFLVDLAVPAAADAQGEADLAYWKRRVAQSCIYGVDLNPLAVDLAKLSLWLATVAKDKPLSFLDHHLRYGNALVGGRVAELGAGAARPKKAPKKAKPVADTGQMSMLDDPAFAGAMGAAVGTMWRIEDTRGDTIDEVRRQEDLYATVRAELTNRYKALADIAVAAGFGVAVEPALWRALAEYEAKREAGAFATPAYEKPLAEVRQLAAEHRFFHWDLEFPEVFFDRHGRPLGDAAGFDVVLGNPPYVRQEQLAPLKPYLAQAYPEVYAGTADLYVYFVRQGLRRLRTGGRLAYIASNSWLRANYAGPLRAFLRAEATVAQLVDLGDNRVFTDAPDVYPAILVAQPDVPPEGHAAQVAVFSRGEGVKAFEQQVAAKLAPVSIHDQADTGWQLSDDAGRRVFAKLVAGGKPLGEVVNGRIYYGVKTGLNDAFIIDQATRDRLVREDPASAALLHPMLRGEDLRPWYQEDEGRWLIGIPHQWTRTQLGAGLREEDAWERFAERHPSIAAHLVPFADAARKRQDKGEYWWELRPCDYYAAFAQPKIFWPDITKFPRFSWDTTGAYLGNTGYIAVPEHPWILGYLASRCAWFLISHTAIALGERAGIMRYRLIDQYMRPLPIPDAPPAERDAIGELAMRITAEAQARYELHRRARRRVLADLGAEGRALNQKLTAWWDLDFSAFRAEVQKVFRRAIPLKERDDWEEWLGARVAEHRQRTDAIVRMETELNARVAALFDLTPAEVAIVEASTKYRYGEV